MYHFRRLDATVDELLAQGRHADAAAAARAAGDAARAATIYAQIWDFRRAAECALEAGDRLAAIAHLIDAKAPGEAVLLADTEGTDRAAAASLLAARRLFGPAAALLEKLGERERAAEVFQRAGQPADAARVLEDLGRLREAGRLLERIAAGEAATTAEERAAAQLALGRILARLGHHEEAVRHLQEASRHESTRARALPLIAPELAALGWSHAAAEAARGLGGAPPVALLPAAPGPGDAETPLIGGRYRPLRLLGAGAAGRVFLCRDEVSGAEVALKLFTVVGGAGTQGGDSYRRFLREAEIWRRAHHPNILRILDLRPDLGFLVTELAEGGTLADRRGPLPPGRVRRIALDVLAGLGHAHDRGVVHRDVKPANVFLDGRGVAKLGDFGVAHLLDLGATQTGALIGTLAYMSPEQITGAPLGAAADLYALGVTFFEALTGRRPFLGPDFIAQHLGEPPPRAAELEPAVPPAWDLLLGDLLAKDPAARPGSAAEVAERVRVLEGPGPRPILTLPRPPTPPADAPPERAAAEAEPRSRYEGETPIGETPTARLSRAVDRALERTVVIERFVDGAPDAASERRLFGLAAAGTPFVQRVLSYDRTARVAVYEAPVGDPATAAAIPRLAAELTRALTALAEVGCVHGAVAAARVLYDEQAGTTLLAAGLPAADPAATTDDDARAVAELLTGLRADAPSG